MLGIGLGLFVFGIGAGLATVAWKDAIASQVVKDRRSSVSANLGGILRLSAIAAPLAGSIFLDFLILS